MPAFIRPDSIRNGLLAALTLAITAGAQAASAFQADAPAQRPRTIVQTGTPAGGDTAGMPTYGARPGTGTVSVTQGNVSVAGHALTYYTLKIDPGTGFLESFIVFAPTPLPVTPRPMLVAFHGFGVTQKDIVKNTTFVNECAARGWFLLAPISASGAHFMCDPGQINTQAAMDWALAALNVDKSRIYAAGFSMGGGMVLNYSARHLDPMRGMFAAAVDHTGAVDVNDVYASDPGAQFVFDFWYGDGSSGSADPALMRRASVIEYVPSYAIVNPTTDLARNLGHLPLRVLRAQNDPLGYLRTQSDRLVTHMQGLGRSLGSDFVYDVLPGDQHSWGLLDEGLVCDWLAQFSLTLPSSGSTLAVTEATYFHFFVDQEQPGGMTPFTWSIDEVANRFDLGQTANLALLAVDTASAGLSTTQLLTVSLATKDGKGDRVVLTDYAVPPSMVLRDGVPAAASAWSHNATAGNLLLQETDGGQAHTWVIHP